MSLHGDFRGFLSSLISHQVRFLIVGAHALAVHGRPRFTGDLDVWTAREQSNADKLVRALADFGFEGLDAAPFTEENRILSLGREPVRIDIFTHIPGLSFEDAWPRRVEADLGNLRVPVLGRADFVASKKAAGRPQDLLDLELLDPDEGGGA